MSGLAQKKETTKKLKTEVDAAKISVVVDYRGLTVAEITHLRRELMKDDAKLMVAKNTLLKRAIKDSELEGLSDHLSGPTALLLGLGDQVKPIKTVKQFLKTAKKDNEIRGGFMEGRVIDSDEVEQLAKLPPLEELQGKLVGSIAAPVNGIVQALITPHRKLAIALNEYSKQLEQKENS